MEVCTSTITKCKQGTRWKDVDQRFCFKDLYVTQIFRLIMAIAEIIESKASPTAADISARPEATITPPMKTTTRFFSSGAAPYSRAQMPNQKLPDISASTPRRAAAFC